MNQPEEAGRLLLGKNARGAWELINRPITS
jgi:hypothetical protein